MLVQTHKQAFLWSHAASPCVDHQRNALFRLLTSWEESLACLYINLLPLCIFTAYLQAVKSILYLRVMGLATMALKCIIIRFIFL